MRNFVRNTKNSILVQNMLVSYSHLYTEANKDIIKELNVLKAVNKTNKGKVQQNKLKHLKNEDNFKSEED